MWKKRLGELKKKPNLLTLRNLKGEEKKGKRSLRSKGTWRPKGRNFQKNKRGLADGGASQGGKKSIRKKTFLSVKTVLRIEKC